MKGNYDIITHGIFFERTFLIFKERKGFNIMDKFAYFVGQEVTGIINNVTKTAIYLILESELRQTAEEEQATEEKGGRKAVIYVNDIEGFQENQNLRDVYHEGEEFKALVKQIGKDRRTEEPLYILSTKLYATRTIHAI